MWHNCRIQYRHAASSFSFNIFENPTSKCALFVDDYVVKWSEQRTKFLLTRSGTSLKIKQKYNWDCDSPTNQKKTGGGWGETPSWLWSALGVQQYTIKSPIWMPHSFKTRLSKQNNMSFTRDPDKRMLKNEIITLMNESVSHSHDLFGCRMNPGFLMNLLN